MFGWELTCVSEAAQAIDSFHFTEQTRKRQPDDLEWREAHIGEYHAQGLQWGCLRPHAGDKSSAWWSCLRAREQDVLVVQLIKSPWK